MNTERYNAVRQRDLREARGWSYGVMTSHYFQTTGKTIAIATLHSYEDGRTEPSITIASRIARTLGVPFDDLIERIDN